MMERDGHIYLVHAETSHFYKIGHSSRSVVSRLANLQTACPLQLALIATRPGTQCDEKKLHWRYYKFHVRGEWFEFRDIEPVLHEFTLVPNHVGGYSPPRELINLPKLPIISYHNVRA